MFTVTKGTISLILPSMHWLRCFLFVAGTKYAVRNDGKEPSVLHLQILDYQEEWKYNKSIDLMFFGFFLYLWRFDYNWLVIAADKKQKIL